MTSAFFAHVKRRREPVLVKKFLRDLESGLFETPKSFDVFSRYRGEDLKLNRSGEALRVYYPENRLIAAFCQKYPQAKAQPITLNSFNPPIAKQFALRQLQLIAKEGLPQAQAFKKVEQEMAPQILALTRQTLGSNISQLALLQQEEEQQLQQALVAVAQGKLPTVTSDRSSSALDPSSMFGLSARRRRPKQV